MPHKVVVLVITSNLTQLSQQLLLVLAQLHAANGAVQRRGRQLLLNLIHFGDDCLRTKTDADSSASLVAHKQAAL